MRGTGTPTSRARRASGPRRGTSPPSPPSRGSLFCCTPSRGSVSARSRRSWNVPEGEAQALVDRAGQQISAQLRTSVLIIEDEPLIAADLTSLVEQLGHEVTTIARTHDEAVRAALQRRSGLILSDIQLADGSSGLDAVNDVSDRRNRR